LKGEMPDVNPCCCCCCLLVSDMGATEKRYATSDRMNSRVTSWNSAPSVDLTGTSITPSFSTFFPNRGIIVCKVSLESHENHGYSWEGF
jgi:hypothetical protein